MAPLCRYGIQINTATSGDEHSIGDHAVNKEPKHSNDGTNEENKHEVSSLMNHDVISDIDPKPIPVFVGLPRKSTNKTINDNPTRKINLIKRSYNAAQPLQLPSIMNIHPCSVYN